MAPVVAHGPAHRAPPGPRSQRQCLIRCHSHGARAAAGRGPWVSVRRAASGKASSGRPRRLWPASLLCQGERGLQASILERTGQSWLPSPSRTLYFLLPEPPTPPRAWCCLSPCDPSSCPTSTPGLTGANPSPPGQPQGQTPVDDTHAEVEIKPQLRPRGSVSEEEDPKPSHHYASCRLNPHNQLGRLCIQGRYERSLRALTKENALVL